MIEKPDWAKLNFDNIQEYSDNLSSLLLVEDELSDLGIHCKEIEDLINTNLIHLKIELEKIGDD